ncbi:domino helicase isoform X3 [Tachypleus tridentatus]|uniref:domino helicase isoform X3 n=1 Tax=Tachypleus tridentatus TaxID=6853 RepID=UPI003FD33ECF
MIQAGGEPNSGHLEHQTSQNTEQQTPIRNTLLQVSQSETREITPSEQQIVQTNVTSASSIQLQPQGQRIALAQPVAVSLQQGSVRTTRTAQTEASVSSTSYTISSPQGLARILAAASQSYNVRTGNRPVTSSDIGLTGHSQLQAQSTVPVTAVSVQNVQLQKLGTAGSTVLTLPVATVSMPQRTVVGTGKQDGVAVCLTTSGTGATVLGQQQQQAILLNPTGALHVQRSNVNRVHSYSLASANTVTGPLAVQSGSTVLQVGTPNQSYLASSVSNLIPQSKVVPSLSCQVAQGQTPNKRNANSSHSTSVNTCMSSVSNNTMPTVNSVTSNNAIGVGGPPSKTYSVSPVTNRNLSPHSSPKPKRLKLELKPPPNEEIARMRNKILAHKIQQLKRNKEKYTEHLTEFFFLQNGGNMMDYFLWKKRATPQLMAYLKAHALDSDEEEQKVQAEIRSIVPGSFTSTPAFIRTGLGRPGAGDLGSQPRTISSFTSSSQLTSSSRLTISTTGHTPTTSRPSLTALSVSHGSSKPPKSSPTAFQNLPNRFTTRQHSLSAVYDSTIGSQEEIVERAKQEAYVVQRISELRKEGLWSAKRLPKVQEPPRTKAHWDYLLEEMVWLATDFAQERKWKKAAAKKCAKMVVKYHQERQMKAEKAEKEELQRLKRIAGQVAKEIKQFWANIEKLVEYKTQTRLEEKRKKALDLHLNFIVDQTEKYSSWLTQGMNRSIHDSSVNSKGSSVQESRTSSPISGSSVDEFRPEGSSSDDEETIDREEAAGINEEEQNQEIDLLQKESEVPIEELLKTLPAEILEKPAPLMNEEETATESETEDKSKMSSVDLKNAKKVTDDEEFQVESCEEEEDDENSLEEQEIKEKNIDYEAEIKDLQEEGECSIEELYEKYAGAYASDFEIPESGESLASDSEIDEEEEEVESISNYEDVDVGMEYLASMDGAKDQVFNKDEKPETTDDKTSKGPGREITDIAAAAESFQPKGNTLSTTQVFTKVPFLLKHQLREYQHIGLDWLVAMHDRKLNGILADEMGLGKTIQTIAVLAHQACEKGNWGPHLIVVPTSVMLNWEMEFKKWCPAFKILTYYGNPKERKQKRQGWTKPNAFHVCITSYKLVIQDHQAFRRKRWKYFILDEAQHIKNFKSQRWQMLQNFQSTHRLLLTGTPLQNSLMELWSLMHFLMPDVFQSHKEFREWFANPVTGMIEGSHEYNESLIKRLHKVLRPFLLRRLKSEVEKQLPKKYEHVIMCRLSKRQRFLYEDFMSQTKTKETLASGNFMSVINILMQLRKVCNHPNLFETRATVSPFMMEGLCYNTSSLVWSVLEYDPFKHVSLWALNLLLADLELCLTAFAAHRIKKFQTLPRFIEEIDNYPDPPPKCPPGKIRLHIRTSTASQPGSGRASPMTGVQNRAVSPAPLLRPTAPTVPSRPIGFTQPQLAATQQRLVVFTSSGNAVGATSQSISPVAALGTSQSGAEYTLHHVQKTSAGLVGIPAVSSKLGTTFHLQQNTQLGTGVATPFGIGRLLQTPSGQHVLLTPATSTVSSDQSAVLGVGATVSQQLTQSSRPLQDTLKEKAVPSTVPATTVSTNVTLNTSTPASTSAGKPVMKVTPLCVVTQPATAGITVTPSNPKLFTNVTPSNSVTCGDTSYSVEQKMDNTTKLLFQLKSLEEKKKELQKNKLKLLGYTNSQRCAACPIYGHDLVEAVTVTSDIRQCPKGRPWGGMGYVNCQNAPSTLHNPRNLWHQTQTLSEMVYTPETLLSELHDIISRFVFVVPGVSAPRIKMHTSHPPTSKLQKIKLWKQNLQKKLAPLCRYLHPIISNMSTQFPDLRLIQYDCGKLQTLDKLLWHLKNDGHRILIFTQMSRILDILEQFLNYHGHTYLRLDGSTRIEQRQALMERFNADKRIFCFILSTRSGGIGVNLTGADTVIFYDSDWNPTMDAQAQDRCHRIGQTRDVHIYRLVSEMTVEENILKKAGQKRLLGDLAIEGGNFTSVFFQKNAIRELFGIKEDNSTDKCVVKKEPTDSDVSKLGVTAVEEKPVDLTEKFLQTELEHALGMAEEENDVEAAKTARAEAAAELAEFDESIPIDSETRDNEERSQAEEELDKLMDQLTPVEKYAMQFLETIQDSFSLEQLKQAEEEIEAQKKDWELGRLKAFKEEEERRRASYDEEEDPKISYSREDAYNQVYVSLTGQEEMPIWCPPTPPTEENDLYVDHSLGFLYEDSIMTESQLPPVFVKKEVKHHRVDAASTAVVTRKQKVRKEETVHIPRSLFDRPSAAILKMRREAKMQKVKGLMVGPMTFQRPFGLGVPAVKPPVPYSKSSSESQADVPEWLVHEDWALLQVIQSLQGLPLNLTVLSPAHIPNWDLVADVFNSVSRTYRSPKQCKARYESVIVPREEGRILYDTNPKKQKKTKGIYKTKNNRPMRTSQLYIQDNNNTFTSLYNNRFETIKSVANKRTPTLKPLFVNPAGKNLKHAAVLAESGIVYDQPLSPVKVASNRADRIAREKQRTQQAAAAAAAAAEQQLTAQRQQQQQQVTVTAQGISQQQAAHAQAVIASLTPQTQQLQAVHASQLTKAALQGGATTVSLAKQLSTGIVVNTAATAATLATLSKALGQSGVAAVQTQGATLTAANVTGLTQATLRTQRASTTGITTTTMTLPEAVVAAAGLTGQARTIATTGVNTVATPSIVSVAGLTAAQIHAATRLNAAVTVGSNQLTSARTLTGNQLHVYRQNAMRQQRLQDAHQLKRLQAAQAGKVAVTLASHVTAQVAAAAAAAAAQQRTAQQAGVRQGITKQGVARTMTEADLALLKRQHIQKQAVAQLNQAQLLAQVQLQGQQPITGTVQSPVATLVKTVSAPTSAVTIPVSAVSKTGVNINVSLPQPKATGSVVKGTSVTPTQHQVRLSHLQHQLALQQAQQRKVLHHQQKVTSLAQVQGKAALPAQLSTVQILQGSPRVATQLSTKALLEQVINQVAAGGTSNFTAVGTQAQLLPHAFLQAATTTSAVSKQQSVTSTSAQSSVCNTTLGTSVPLAVATTVQARVVPLGQPQPAFKQAIQVVSAAPNLAAGVQAGLVAGTLKSHVATQGSIAVTTATAALLKGTPAVVVSGQQQTPAVIHQVAPSSTTVSNQQPMTLAVRATPVSQPQVQVQQSGPSSINSSQSQVITPAQPGQNQPQVQLRTVAHPQAKTLSQSTTTVILAQALAGQAGVGQNVTTTVHEGSSSQSLSGTNVITTSVTPSLSSPAQVVQAAIQAAKQQQRASPYTMRLRNPPKQ